MTIGLKKDDLEISVMIVDNYYTEDDNSPKVLYIKVFKDLNEAEKHFDEIVKDPKKEFDRLGLKLSLDQNIHNDDIHILVKSRNGYEKEVTASSLNWA